MASRNLGFFLQRAAIAGATIPEDEVWAVYHESLAAGVGQALPSAATRRVGDAADLWSRALYGPTYVAESSEADVTSMLQQIRVLAGRLGLA